MVPGSGGSCVDWCRAVAHEGQDEKREHDDTTAVSAAGAQEMHSIAAADSADALYCCSAPCCFRTKNSVVKVTWSHLVDTTHGVSLCLNLSISGALQLCSTLGTEQKRTAAALSHSQLSFSAANVKRRTTAC